MQLRARMIAWLSTALVAGSLAVSCASSSGAGDTGDAAVAGDGASSSSGSGSSGSSSGGDSGSTSSGGSNATTYFTTVLNGGTGGCLSQTLPTDAAGRAQCQLFFVLAAGDTCAAHAGLPAAGADVVASLRAFGQVTPSQPVCVVAQLPAAVWVNGSCATSSQTGWCYVTGPGAGKCAQTIAQSPSAALPANAFAYFGCGETPPGTSVGAANASAVGARCVPSLELSASFAGFSVSTVTLDENNSACGGDVCLVNHFKGRTTCPYGQNPDGTPVAGTVSGCTVPGTSVPVRPNDPIAGQAVQPQCLDRVARQTVYCSCRCANAMGRTDDGASYCACPTGYACTQVVPAVASGDPRSGGYCVKSGTAYNPSVGACASKCDPSLGNCP